MSAHVSAQDVMRVPVAPSVVTVPEAIQEFVPQQVAVAPPGLWDSITNGVKKIFRRKKKKKDVPDPESVTATATLGGGTVSATAQAPSETETTPTPTPTPTTTTTPETPTPEESVEEELDVESEYAQLSPEEKLAHLYSTLGSTDAYLQAVYADPLLVAAALAQGADRFVAFLAEGALGAAVVERAPGVFAGKFGEMMDGLTVGSGMSPQTRQGLRRMLPGMTTDQAKVAFGKRFAHEMTDNGGAWSLTNITMVWDQLAVLPDQDVSDNTILTTFQAITGGGGFGPSWEAPNTVNTIQLGEDITDPAFMSHTVRHEVGHAVHAQIPGQVNPWLQNIGFWFYNGDAGGVTTLITELGGFPAQFTAPDGTVTPWDPGATAWVVELLKGFLGGGSSWGPSRPTVTDGQGDWQTAYWDAMPQGVKDVATQSPAHWYSNYGNFAQGAKGSYFLNYWYARPFYMSGNAKAVVDAVGDDYTAMSEKEFFANAYAEYFEDPAGYNDHDLWGGSLPAGVQEFFKTVVVDRQPYVAPVDAAPPGQGAPPPPPGQGGMSGTP